MWLGLIWFDLVWFGGMSIKRWDRDRTMHVKIRQTLNDSSPALMITTWYEMEQAHLPAGLHRRNAGKGSSWMSIKFGDQSHLNLRHKHIPTHHTPHKQTQTQDPKEPPGWRKTLSYMGQPMSVIDALSILPYYLSYFQDIGARTPQYCGIFIYVGKRRPGDCRDQPTPIPSPTQPIKSQTHSHARTLKSNVKQGRPASPPSCASSA